MASISVIIPTLGRPTLNATLRSVTSQISDRDEVIVVADTRGSVSNAMTIIGRHSSARVRTMIATTDEVADYGYSLRHLAMAEASGTHLAFIDDDDVYTDGALDLMRDAACDRPVIFRMRYVAGYQSEPPGYELWSIRRVAYTNIGTPMFVVPNDPARLGRWEPWPGSWSGECGGDFAFINGCVERMGDPVWREEVVALIRPHEA